MRSPSPILVVLCAFTLSLAACGDDNSVPPGEPTDSTVDADTGEPPDAASGDVTTTPDAPLLEETATEVDAEEDIEEDVPNPCGEWEALDENEECGCAPNACRSVITDACQERWWVTDWGDRTVEQRMLAEVRNDLLNKYVDSSAIADRVNGKIEFTLENTVGTPAWSALGIGYLAFSDHLCALYQLGVDASENSLTELALADLADNLVPKAWMAITLMSVVSNRADRCIAHEILLAMEAQLDEAEAWIADDPATWPNDYTTDTVKGAMLRYIVTAKLFDHEPDELMVDTFLSAMYPDDAIDLGDELTAEGIIDMAMAYHLDLEFDLQKLHELIAMAWTGTYFTLADCTDPLCKAKSLHRVATLDVLWGIVPHFYMLEMGAFMLADFDPSTGKYPFVTKLGMDQEGLFAPSYCDIFCSAKHWHMTMTLNHILKKVQTQEAELKARIAELEGK